jgi:hypothetical protein
MPCTILSIVATRAVQSTHSVVDGERRVGEARDVLLIGWELAVPVIADDGGVRNGRVVRRRHIDIERTRSERDVSMPRRVELPRRLRLGTTATTR